jgi:hypothetical protein
MADADRDGDENFKLGIGIIERLGGRDCGARASPGVSRPEVEKVPNDVEEVGDRARPFSSENDRHWIEGAGILLGVFGRARGEVISSLRGYSVVSVMVVVHVRYGRMSGYVRGAL